MTITQPKGHSMFCGPQKASDHPANEAARERKNRLARERRARKRAEREAAENATRLSGPLRGAPVETSPCPFCDKPTPPYGHPGAALLRVDNATVICSDCGTREALEGGLKMPVSRFVELYTSSHNIYLHESLARRFERLTGHRAPWTPRTAQSIRREIEARGLGGHYDSEEKGVSGFEVAAACAVKFAQFHSFRQGRGRIWDECIQALRGNGK